MTQQIKLMYVDDKLDMLLTDYLDGFEKDDIKIVYDEIKFDSSKDDES